jgi:hypothetical protein
MSMSDERSTHALIKGDYYAGASGPTIILILYSTEACVWLQGVFRDLAANDGPRVLTTEPRVQIANVDIIEMTSRPDGPMVALRRTDNGSEKSFIWSATVDGWLYQADLIQSFCDGGSGHHYLTDDKDDVATVEVSFGEQDVLDAARRHSL